MITLFHKVIKNLILNFIAIVLEYFECNNVQLNIPGLDKRKINASNSKSLEMFLIKQRRDKYPEDIYIDYKLNKYNNSINMTINKEVDNNTFLTNNKKYFDNVTTRMNPRINKALLVNQRKIKQYEDTPFTNAPQEIALKKNLEKINSKKIAFMGMSGKRSKLIFNDNKNFFMFNNNNINNYIKDKKHNLKPLIEVKQYNNERKRNLINQNHLINNKHFSSLEIRPKNKILTQNDFVPMDNNTSQDVQNYINVNRIINEEKDLRKKSSENLLINERHKDNSKKNKNNENVIIKNIKKHKRDVIERNNILNNKNLNLDSLSQKEKTFFILSQSKILQLKERIIFSRATENLRSLIPIKEIKNSNQLFIKEKLNNLKLKLIDYTKKLEEPFSPSKTADISLNIIKKVDEDYFKNFLQFYNNIEEKEKKYYKTYICLLYLLLGENINEVNFENIDSNSLFDKLNKKGYEHFKDYLYINFVKQNSKILNEQNRMNIFSDLYRTLPDLIRYSGNIKGNKFVCFSYFLIKEIYDYWNNFKNLVELKNKTQSYIEYLKAKLTNNN